jgi:myo-inositol-1(or 4)-monophosphatase
VNAPDPRYLATAIEVVTRAGAIQRLRFGSDLRIDKKGAIDLVTEVDVEIEQMCRRLLGQRFPDHDILAEEQGGVATAGRSHRWVFDPLDGTTNFAHGVPIFCASLALEIDGEAVVGAVFDPNRQELFTAERGVGAWLNGAPIRVSSTAAMIDALLVTGFPYDVHTTLDEVIGLFSAFVAKARAIRRLGSAAIDMCWVGAGRMDGFWEQRLQPWDTRAAALLVQEAGGTVTGLDGGVWDPEGGHLLASNGPLHAAMCEVVAQFRDRRPNKTV